MGKVTRTFVSGGKEMLVCQAHGFYPKEIEATWRKGGEIMEQDTFRRSVAPNSDGTYHAWLSIEINPKDRELYRCHIDHTGLTEPLVLAWEAPGGEQLQGREGPGVGEELSRGMGLKKGAPSWAKILCRAIACSVPKEREVLFCGEGGRGEIFSGSLEPSMALSQGTDALINSWFKQYALVGERF